MINVRRSGMAQGSLKFPSTGILTTRMFGDIARISLRVDVKIRRSLSLLAASGC